MILLLRAVSVLLVLVGAVWIFQGLGVLPGSFMTGDLTWTWIGGAAVVAGIALFVTGERGRRGRRV